jgi:Transcription factor WhiB
MIPVIVAELLDTLAHGIPDLHGAACRGHPQLFDVADRHDTPTIAQAKALCASCPVLGDCRAWLASLPRACLPKILGRVFDR